LTASLNKRHTGSLNSPFMPVQQLRFSSVVRSINTLDTHTICPGQHYCQRSKWNDRKQRSVIPITIGQSSEKDVLRS
jgi:hypothetical protein